MFVHREDSKVSHYIINKIEQNGQTYFRIGDQSFSNLPELLSFYKLHYLDTTPLSRPAAKRLLHNTESHNHHFHHHHHQHQQTPQQQQQQSQTLHMHDNGGLHHQHVPPTSSMRCIERVIGKYDFEGSGVSIARIRWSILKIKNNPLLNTNRIQMIFHLDVMKYYILLVRKKNSGGQLEMKWGKLDKYQCLMYN